MSRRRKSAAVDTPPQFPDAAAADTAAAVARGPADPRGNPCGSGGSRDASAQTAAAPTVPFRFTSLHHLDGVRHDAGERILLGRRTAEWLVARRVGVIE